MRSGMLLAHEAAGQPPLREVLGTLLCQATHADVAVAHLRLFAIDLSPAEAAGLARCRVLLGRLDAAGLDELGPAGDGVAPRARALITLLDSGRVRVRSGGALAWCPDFSIFRGLPRTAAAPAGAACLVGAHFFNRPHAGPGAALTALLTGERAVALAGERFDALWHGAHDVDEAVRGALAAGLASP
jgi:hypothetical protein